MTAAYEANKRWRQRNPETRHAGKKRYYRKTAWAPNHRKEWTSEEMELLKNFPGTDSELSSKIGRSVRAIQTKRHRTQENPR